MYAVIETGGKQYRVEPGDIIDIERLPGADGEAEDGEAEDAEANNEVTFDRVLMVGGDEVKIGRPTVEGAQVKAQRVADVRGRKVIVFKMKRRKGYRRKNGHRQSLTRVRIQDIQV